jgi:predicted amidohydrolase YtcJ
VLLRNVEVDGRPVDVRIDDGKIAEMDTSLSGDDEVIEGGGGALLPGLHDHHVHVLSMAAAAQSVNLYDASDVGAALQDADSRLPRGAWLRAVGGSDDVDRRMLDSVVPERPVRVQHRSGALWVLNTAALHRVGIVEPTGRLFGADDLLRERIDDAPPLEVEGVGRRLASYGVTGVTDATPFDDMSGPRVLAAAGLPQRLVLMGAPSLDIENGPAGVEWGPAKVFLADHALPPLPEVVEQFLMARRRDRNVAVHSVTVASLVLALAAWDEVGVKPGDRVEHGAVIPADLIPRLADLELTVVTQPNFVVEREAQYRAEIPVDEQQSLYRCCTLLDAGVRVAFGTDAPFGGADPWRAIAAASERSLGREERVDAATALGRFLSDPLRAGRPADLCLLHEPLAEALRNPSADLVAATLCDGSVRFVRSSE